MRIEDENERRFYEIETFKNNWSVRELDRQYDSGLYTRLALSRD
jgi:predicted nuclease of restriction endonuclease-like (RecB) superfamily